MRSREMAANRLSSASWLLRWIDPQYRLRHLFLAGIVGARVYESQIDPEVLIVISGQALRPGDLVDNSRLEQSVFHLMSRCMNYPASTFDCTIS